MSWIMVNNFLLVITVTVLMCCVVYEGYLDGVKVELDDEHYAERVHISMKRFLPPWIKMPLNSIVNIGYVVVGAAWCAVTTVDLAQDKIRTIDAQMFYIFNFGSCCYGPIQTLRILTQLQGFAILDQWYTLPFFMWVFLWGMNTINCWSSTCNIIFVTSSIGSYFLALYHTRGFEICLSVHICFAFVGAFYAWSNVPQAKCRNAFIGALMSCAGFVILKLCDLELIKYHDIFKYISGHFISKIFDVLQIHFVNSFFHSITEVAYVVSKKKEK